MPVISQQEYAQQLVAQLRLLKPSFSGEIGTPERLILDVVAEALTDSSVDLAGLEEALNVDSKFGSNLSNFLAIFGFDRHKSTQAIAFVIFSRTAPSNADIIIPQGTLLQSSVRISQDGPFPQFVTTAALTLQAGELQTALVPVIATTPGATSNVPANSITNLSVGENVIGVTAVTNPAPASGGEDQEDDNSFKVRFKNTIFRNLAGTKDQFLALAIATAFSTKANVVGPISKYQEYFQIPLKDDSETEKYGLGAHSLFPGTPAAFMIEGSSTGTATFTVVSTNGVEVGMPVKVFQRIKGGHPEEVVFGGSVTVSSIVSGTQVKLSLTPPEAIEDSLIFFGTLNTAVHQFQYTTALSSIPYAKNIWTKLPVFASNSQGISKYFYREGVDYTFNFPGLLQGDTLRDFIDGSGTNPRVDPLGSTQPNITFTNVYRGNNESVKAISPNDTVLIEYQYTSTASRNSLDHNVTNAVDVYIDGGNDQPSSTIFAAPLSSLAQEFIDSPTSMYYYENYRRDGEPIKRPLEGNILTPLYQQPVTSLPGQITIGKSTYYLGVHYWLVHDISAYAGTTRARDGIEWSKNIPGDESGLLRPTAEKFEPEYTGTKFGALVGSSENPTLIEVDDYTFDQNIEDLQATLEASRQITTDVLAHKAKLRFFKLDITIIYASQATIASVNSAIQAAVTTYLASKYFGGVIRLSDLLQVIHNVPGVENVRWSNDVINNESLIRLYETDNSGRPLLNVSMDRAQWGATIAKQREIQTLYITGQPETGSYVLEYLLGVHEIKTAAISITATASQIETIINAAFAAAKTETKETIKAKVSEDNRSTAGVANPIKSFRIEFECKNEVPEEIFHEFPLPSVVSELAGGKYVFDVDFFLRDDELPALPAEAQAGDTVAGLIIRPRAQNVWQRS